MTGLWVFLLALPLSVYLLAGALSVLDGSEKSLARLTLRLALACLFVALVPADSRLWAGSAFLTVVFLHVTTTLMARYAVRSGRWPTDRTD